MRPCLATIFLLVLFGAGAAWTQSYLGGWSIDRTGPRYTWQLKSAEGALSLTWFSNVAEDALYRTLQCPYWCLECAAAIPAALAGWWWRRAHQERRRRGFPVIPSA